MAFLRPFRCEARFACAMAEPSYTCGPIQLHRSCAVVTSRCTEPKLCMLSRAEVSQTVRMHQITNDLVSDKPVSFVMLCLPVRHPAKCNFNAFAQFRSSGE